MPSRSYLWWSLALGVCGPILAAVAGYAACVNGASFGATLAITCAVTLPALAIGAVLVSRRQSENKGDVARPKWASILVMAAVVLVGFAAFFIEERIYTTTGSRAAEGLIAFALVFPAGVLNVWAFLGFRRTAGTNRFRLTSFTFGVSAFAFFAFLANQILALWLPDRHRYPDFVRLSEFNIAVRFIIIFMYPPYLFMTLKFLRANRDSFTMAR